MNRVTRYFISNYSPVDEFVIFRVQMLTHFLLAGVVINLTFAVLFSTFLHTNVPNTVFVLTALLYAFLLLLVKQGFSLNVVSQLLISMCFLSVAGAAFFSGGANSYVLSWLCFLPVLSVLLLSFRKTVIWFVVVLVTLFALGFADPWLPPMKYTDDPWRSMISATGLSLLLFYFTTLFDSGRYKLLSILKEKNHQLELNQKTINTKNEELLRQKIVIEEYNKRLEERVHERTLDLENKNKQLEEYAFINSHMLRAPLSNILGLINVIEKSELTKKETEVISHLKGASVQLDEVISRINKALDENVPFNRWKLDEPGDSNRTPDKE